MRSLLFIIVFTVLLGKSQTDSAKFSRIGFAFNSGIGGLNAIHFGPNQNGDYCKDYYDPVFQTEISSIYNFCGKHLKKSRYRYFSFSLGGGMINYQWKRNYVNNQSTAKGGTSSSSIDPGAKNITITRGSVSAELSTTKLFKKNFFLSHGIGYTAISFFRSKDYYYTRHSTGISYSSDAQGNWHRFEYDYFESVKDYYISPWFGMLYYSCKFGYKYNKLMFYLYPQIVLANSSEIDNYRFLMFKVGLNYGL